MTADETPAQPTTEACCVCGSTDVGYHNYREQPFCWPCADGKSCWTNAAQPDAAPAPDGNAGGADVYRDEVALRFVETLCEARPGALTYLALLGEEALRSALTAASDAARAPLLAELDEAQRQADVLKQQLDDRDADVRTAEGERDEARAKTDGGEAALLTAVAGMHRRIATQHQQVTELVEQHMAETARELVRLRRMLPVEPVTDDGGAG